MAQWKRAGPITQRSVDRNHALLSPFIVGTLMNGNISYTDVVFSLKMPGILVKNPHCISTVAHISEGLM